MTRLPSTPLATAARRSVPLEARTVAVDDPGSDEALLAHLGPEGFAWLDGRVGFVTAGVAARVAAPEAARLLATIRHDGPRPAPAAGPVAVGALPFSGDGALAIPARVVGRTADGRAWCTTIGAGGPARPVLRRAPRGPTRFTLSSTVDSDRWEAMVGEAQRAIAAGALQKVVLAREVTVEADEPFDVPTVLTRLRASQPGCTVYSDRGFVGASPELLVRVAGDMVVSRPMAGTATRGATTGDDEAAVAALLHSTKDGEEHRLVVDAVADVLARWCTNVEVGLPEAARLATVTHLATTVRARRSRGGPAAGGALDLALALHPTPAVGGTPRAAAVELIGRLEPFARGRYAGPVGWVVPDGDGEWVVALRSASLEATGPGGRARLLAGAGIVAGSQVESEWAETQAKLEPMLRALVRL